jgi:hypothetical protein
MTSRLHESAGQTRKGSCPLTLILTCPPTTSWCRSPTAGPTPRPTRLPSAGRHRPTAPPEGDRACSSPRHVAKKSEEKGTRTFSLSKPGGRPRGCRGMRKRGHSNQPPCQEKCPRPLFFVEGRKCPRPLSSPENVRVPFLRPFFAKIVRVPFAPPFLDHFLPYFRPRIQYGDSGVVGSSVID